MDDQLELLDGEVLQARGRAVHAGVVDQPVQAAEALRGGGDPRFDLRDLRHVDAREVRGSAAGLHQGGRLAPAVLVARGERDGGALRAEPHGDRAADPARSAGHGRDAGCHAALDR
jgi:hypothetical protein